MRPLPDPPEEKTVKPKPKKNPPPPPSNTTTNKDKTGSPQRSLFVNELMGHKKPITAVCFSPDGQKLATGCEDGVVRLFKLGDILTRSNKLCRFKIISLPTGGVPTAVAFSDRGSSVVAAAQHGYGSCLYIYDDGNSVKKHPFEKPPDFKWLQTEANETKAIVCLAGTSARYDAAGGSPFFVSCSKSSDISLWHGKTGKFLGNTSGANQLTNNMAAISPSGRFIAAAACSADVKVWEIVRAEDGTIKEITGAMELKGHTSDVTWLCFSPNSERIITASKDGTVRIWNINVRYDFFENPKILNVFPVPLLDSKGTTLHYEHLDISPDGKILAATHCTRLQWLCVETGKVLSTEDRAHFQNITAIAWAPKKISVGRKCKMVLATVSAEEKKVKFWVAPDSS
ncbi:hypothetical protein MKW94_026730 [Papaver nudicaule]|uniref:Uncharacterized protein n=1 Tax=Papaver nudicaule TaxID=74823 RepID=A0AA41SHU0_PAPNU|nr:hypothetical protein [Papaver nudicaule]